MLRGSHSRNHVIFLRVIFDLKNYLANGFVSGELKFYKGFSIMISIHVESRFYGVFVLGEIPPSDGVSYLETLVVSRSV